MAASVINDQVLRASPPAESSAETTCLHCGSSLGASAGPYCCSGCELVAALLRREHLERYYDLRGERGQPVPEASSHRDEKWLEPIEARLATSSGLCRVDLDVQGLHCSGCVWLIDELFRRRDGGARALVNPALGKVQLSIEPGFALRDFTRELARFGYLLGPSLKGRAGDGAGGHGASRGLLLRMGLCIAIAMNSMIFAIALYAGLSSGPVARLFHTLNFGSGILSVAIGGSVFIRSAYEGLRRRVLHLDTPIALGILLAFGSSTWSFFARDSRTAYFDTLDVFIALMLVGRYLQERVLERNRRALLADDGVADLLTRRMGIRGPELVRCGELQRGDVLLVAPGDLVPVDAVLLEPRASCSLDWINGESRPRAYAENETVPAGAFLAGVTTARLRAEQDFGESALVELIRSPMERRPDATRATPFWDRVARRYVVSVLVAAAIGFSSWLVVTGDVPRALDVVTGLLIVTCPCAFGIAVPMAYELAQAGLRRAGLYVRSPGFLDRALAVRRVVFDKTGTLTTGTLALTAESRAALDALGDDEATELHAMASRSTHPKSAAVARALAGRVNAPLVDVVVSEETGEGLRMERGGHSHVFGAAAFVGAEAGDVAYAKDGVVRCGLSFLEETRPDARAEIDQLRREGFEVFMLSGDAEERVVAMADSLSLPRDHALSARTPGAKQAWLAAHDRQDTLMIGDGINDALVVESAWCSGTPAVDRPFMAARSDFYFTTLGLRPVRLALQTSRALAQTVRRTLGVALAYNALTVGLAYAGLMSPLVCAVLMPVSSLTTILFVVGSLTRRSLWKS